MDTIFLLSILVLAVTNSIILYKTNKRLIDEIIKRSESGSVVTLPWEQSGITDSQAKDDDHIPLEELSDEDLQAVMKASETPSDVDIDREAEKAKEEIN